MLGPVAGAGDPGSLDRSARRSQCRTACHRRAELHGASGEDQRGDPGRHEHDVPVGVVDHRHVRPEARPERVAPAVVAGLRQLGVGGVDRRVAVDEELDDDRRAAAGRPVVGDRPGERRREDELMLVADRDLDVGLLVRVGRELDAEAAVERERPPQVLDEQHDHREARLRHASPPPGPIRTGDQRTPAADSTARFASVVASSILAAASCSSPRRRISCGIRSWVIAAVTSAPISSIAAEP